jgi:hypothetical protein
VLSFVQEWLRHGVLWLYECQQGLEEFVDLGTSRAGRRHGKRREFRAASVVVIDVSPPLRIPARATIGISVSEGCVWACVRGAGVAIKNVSVHGVFLCRVLVGKAPSVYKHEDAEITVNSVSGALGWVAVDKRECCVVCVHACVVAPSSRERQAV